MFCTNCGAKATVKTKFCTNCGEPWVLPQTPAAKASAKKEPAAKVKQEIAPKTPKAIKPKSDSSEVKKRSAIVFIAAVIVSILTFFLVYENVPDFREAISPQGEQVTSGAQPSNSSAEISTTSWVPAGYQAWDADENVAWAWESDHECKAGDQLGCWGVKVITKYGCKSDVYIKIKAKNADGKILGAPHGSYGGPVTDRSVVVVDVPAQNADTDGGVITEISCY